MPPLHGDGHWFESSISHFKFAYYDLGSTAETTSGAFFAAPFVCAFPPPALAGLSPKAASDPENTDAINVGSKSRIF